MCANFLFSFGRNLSRPLPWATAIACYHRMSSPWNSWFDKIEEVLLYWERKLCATATKCQKNITRFYFCTSFKSIWKLRVVIENMQICTKFKIWNEFKSIEHFMSYCLKYGFCKKLLRYKWTSDQLNTFFLPFWLVCFVCTSNQSKSVQLVRGSFVPK